MTVCTNKLYYSKLKISYPSLFSCVCGGSTYLNNVGNATVEPFGFIEFRYVIKNCNATREIYIVKISNQGLWMAYEVTENNRYLLL